MVTIRIPPRYGWRVELWWIAEQISAAASQALARRAGDPGYAEAHWWDTPAGWIYTRRKAAERRRAARLR